MHNASTMTFAKPESQAWYHDGRMLAALAAAAFSLKAIFVKLAYGAYPVDAITLLAIRMGLALPAFLWLATRDAKGKVPTQRDWLGLVAMGLLGYYLSSLFDFIGLQTISAGLERLILFTYPTLVLILEAVWRKKPISRAVWAGMGLTYLGLLAAFGHDLVQPGEMALVLIGGGWVFLSSLTYSAYFMGTAALVGRVGSTRLAGIAGTVASLFVLAHFGLTHPIADLQVLPAEVWLWGAAMALFSTVLPIWLAARAVARLGAGKTAAIGSLGPALTIVFGWLILSEPFSLLQLLGMALVMGGVWWVGKHH
ncbi:DMT family transporter [Chitinimonas sp. BJYL2]|uniref:DMT family transporter n=1 Tax=Chitinimonas sp. BJYL2 TaxID=2976696 RepID=UPI0022B3610E|nr:DMT family transporter [Chitinimonas sp. BJYL2]